MSSKTACATELVGVSELAALLGRPKQSIQGLLDSKRAAFPEPWARLRMGPIWLRSDVEAWITTHPKRVHGR